MRRLLRSVWVTSFVLFAGACNPGEVSVSTHQDEPVSSAAVASPPEAIAKGIPHGGQIVEVAVTEHADAALTFDNLLGLRLWPSLDGTRPPIPVSADAPDSLSLAHAGEDLLAVVLDDAGTVRVIRLGHDGRVHGRVSLPGQYLQALAIEDGVIARTPDHAIEWYSADGTARGRLMPEPGTQVRALVTRHGEVAALIADAKLGTARTLRYITLRTSLEWGVAINLDSPVRDATIALSPSGHRIAYVDLANTVQVYESDLVKRPVPGALTMAREDAREIGFYDDDHVVVGGHSNGDLVMWNASPAQAQVNTNDPWASGSFVSSALHQPVEMTHLVDGFAVADKLVVTGYGGALALDDLTRTRYLGWQAMGGGTISPVGSQLVMTLSGSRFVWLDDKLTSMRDVELRPGGNGPWVYAVPLDERHAVTQTADTGHYAVELVDFDTKAHALISKSDMERVEYSPESHLLAVTSAHRIGRFQLDLVNNTVTELKAIRIKGSAVSVRLFDPSVAGGITAAVTGWDSDFANSQTLTIYRDKDKPLRIHPFDGTVLDARADGTLFVFNRTGKAPELRVMKGKDILGKTPLSASITAAVNADGSRIAYVTGDDVVMVDATGKELWRQTLWSAAQVTFNADATRLFVRAAGGIAVLDATTGIRTALECGWNFGITEQVIASNPTGLAPVCEDPMLQ